MTLLVLPCLLLLWCWLKYGLLPLRWQNSYLAGPDAPLQRACRAATGGRWEPAAQLLEKAGQDWERRSLYAQRLGDVAARGSARWLTEWKKARPEDPDAALVAARARVSYAWELRGGAYADRTSQNQFNSFHRELLVAQEDIRRVVALCPGDPAPLVAELRAARGLGYSHAETDALWSQITDLAPYHFEAHTSALQYWTAKWRGSHQLAREFAEKSAAGAPPGSLLAVLPLIAWYESHKDELGRVGYLPPDIRALVDEALTDAALADPDHPRLAEVRHLLGYFLYLQGRYRAAREQFRHVDGFTEALPWRYSRLPAPHYRAVRTKTGRGALTERRWR
ncbi:hypothetical protein [Streptomyces rubrogriseus]|uniref:hypothetical protein n=1 Tax=Streptomyces rubrogriseus TaxID=194673 RepID=UPI000D58DFA8|nr:hypothetical protein [Streptomyces rubrogriseus]